MEIFIAKSGREAGPFTKDQIKPMLESGMVGLTDSVWHQGLPEWMPVYQFLEMRPPIPGAVMTHKIAGGPVDVTDPRSNNPIVFRAQWKTILFVVVTFGLYSFYLIASYSPQISRITGRRRMDFATVIILEVLTLGVFGMIYQIVLGYHLFNYSKEKNTVGRNQSLLWSMVALNILSFFMAFSSAGMAIPVSLIWGAWSIWILQREINLYAEEWDVA